MANRDHTLDSRIMDAARAEFLANGFDKASLRKIAAEAEVTIGAIYTRYKTKDQLFCALVEPLISSIGSAFSDIRAEYHKGQARWSPQAFAQSMQYESQAILHLLFKDYDRAVLLLCRSRGSSLEHFMDALVQKKIDETLLYFRGSGAKQLDGRVLKLLITGQFQMYIGIISEGYDLETAKAMMNAAMVYHAGGWLAVLGHSSELEREVSK